MLDKMSVLLYNKNVKIPWEEDKILAAEKSVTTLRLKDGASVKLEYWDSLPSTAALAKEYAKAGYPDKYVIFTEKQYSAPITRTRLGEGESESGIFISIILRPSFFPSQAVLIGPLCAAALVSALEEHTTQKPGICWLSDIFCNGRRIGGCALEGKLDSYSSYEYMIITFAVKTDKKNFPPRMTDMIKKVFEKENRSLGTIIAKTILNKFFTVYSSMRSPQKFMNIYKQHFLLTGKKIKLVQNGKKTVHTVLGVDTANGALILDSKSGDKLFITSTSSVLLPKRIRPPKRNDDAKND